MANIMKKLLFSLLWLGWFFLLWTASVSACGCFHDAINPVNKAGYITRWAYVYNVACIEDWKTRIATLSKWTKVRIIGETAYTKIVLPDWRVGRVGNDRVAETSDRSNVPAYPTNHPVQSYCDTTDLSRCPVPIAPGESIKWTYNNPIPGGTPEPSTPPTQTLPPEPTPTTPHIIPVNDSMKSKLDMMANRVNSKIDAKYQDNIDGKIAHYQALISALNGIKSSAVPLSQLIDYLVSKFEETLSLLQVQNVLDI